MPVTAIRFVRKMRGGAQSHLLECSDGRHYVVKFQNNPQHRRILVNELVAGELLRYLQLSSPETALVRVTEEFLRQNPEVHLTIGSRRVPVTHGWHFGSLFPGNPETLAIYDFIPDALLEQVDNLREFRGMLVFDKWAGNADGRQSVFFRARIEDWSRGKNAVASRIRFVAVMIDHGFIFDGPNWCFQDSPVQGLYARRLVYNGVRSLDDFQPWLDLVRYFPEDIVDRAYRQIPPEWIEGDEDEFERVLQQLMARRNTAADLITRCRSSKSNPFGNWR